MYKAWIEFVFDVVALMNPDEVIVTSCHILEIKWPQSSFPTSSLPLKVESIVFLLFLRVLFSWTVTQFTEYLVNRKDKRIANH